MEKKYESFSFTNTEQAKNLLMCKAICDACSTMCIKDGNKKTAAICRECAEACDFAVTLRCCESQFSEKALQLCADICEKCAEECTSMNVKHCTECADICKRCSETCSSSKKA